MPVAHATWRQVMARRVRQHHLAARAPRDALIDVVAQLGGIQAQVASAADLALWARVDGLRPDDVSRALWEERSLVRTWATRGTLHLLPATELEMWQMVLALDRRYLRPAWLQWLGMSAEEFERVTDAVGQVLDERLLTREELVAEVSRLVGSERLGGTLRQSWGMMLKPAAFRSQLCFAPNVGPKARFTHPKSWLGPQPAVPLEEAEREVARRFLNAYGPVTKKVFSQWLGVGMARSSRFIESLGNEAAAVDLEGDVAWMLASQLKELDEAQETGSVRLLPAFDQYVLVASRDAEKLLPGPFRGRIYRPAGWLSAVLLVDGRMDGIWRYEQKGNRLELVIEPFVDLPAWARDGAEVEAERLAHYLGREQQLSWSDP
jgi:uncharacterized protein YcaQ